MRKGFSISQIAALALVMGLGIESSAQELTRGFCEELKTRSEVRSVSAKEYVTGIREVQSYVNSRMQESHQEAVAFLKTLHGQIPQLLPLPPFRSYDDTVRFRKDMVSIFKGIAAEKARQGIYLRSDGGSHLGFYYQKNFPVQIGKKESQITAFSHSAVSFAGMRPTLILATGMSAPLDEGGTVTYSQRSITIIDLYSGAEVESIHAYDLPRADSHVKAHVEKEFVKPWLNDEESTLRRIEKSIIPKYFTCLELVSELESQIPHP